MDFPDSKTIGIVKMKRTLEIILLILLMPNFSIAKNLSQSITYALQTKVSLIAIDSGFGGYETGPTGCDGAALAKNINLQIAKKLAERIRRDLGIDVLLTREKDVNPSLEERAAVANVKGADLLISIHTNGSEASSVSGIETFCLNIVPDRDAISIVATENATNPKNIADMDSILSDLMQHARSFESGLLAKNVQRRLCRHIAEKYKSVNNRGVKQAPFYILLGADMPSIMVQVGFITNPHECRLLSSPEYQDDISIGIVEGIKEFLNERRAQPFREE